jgi:lysophospholipase L1-like esterase
VRFLTHCTVALCATALFSAPAADAAKVARLRRMVVIGDSLLAGYGSGGFVRVGRPGQVDSAAAFVARRARVKLPLPLMRRPGLPPQLAVLDTNGNGRLDQGEVRYVNSHIGFRADADRSVRNLAVPGEDSDSVFDEIAPEDIIDRALGGDLNGRDVLKLFILGLPLRSEPVSQVRRARELRPNVILVWLGNNDVLDMATGTDPSATSLPAAQFGQRFTRLLDALADTGADMAVANLPDVTVIASLRRAGSEVTSCRNAMGGIVPVAADDLLSIDLDPAQLPVPSCGDVLNAAERAQVRAKVGAFNAEIAAAIVDVEQRRGVAIAPVDMFAGVDRLEAEGVDLNSDGTVDLTTDYLGGVFSLDGIHPTRTGHALIANVFIDAINARFGEQIPPVDVARIARTDRLVNNRFRPAGEPPFGLIGEPNEDDLERIFDKTYRRIERHVEDIADELRDLFRDKLDDIF